MTDHLVFALVASLGAAGELAGHERRPTLRVPGRAALLGLLGAAMGIERDGDFSVLDTLNIAIAPFSVGPLLRDYHTVQTVPAAATRHLKRAPHGRAEALREAGRQVATTVTLRDHHTDLAYGVSLRGSDLPRIELALARPDFAPFLGRRACTLSAPMDARIVVATDHLDALSAVRLPPWMAGQVAKEVHLDLTPGMTVPPSARIELRNDRPLDRALRHFGPREVAVVPVRILADVAEAA